MLAGPQLLAVIDALEQAVLLVTQRAVVLHVNRVAAALLDAGGLTRDAAGAVACPRPADSRRLRRLVAEASRGPRADAAVGGLMVVHRRPCERPLSLQVVPLQRHAAGTADYATVALLASDPGRPLATAEPHLRELYRLTPAEARVAAAIVELVSPLAVAERLAISVHAVRVHLKRVFAKTGTRRQSELVRLLLAHRLPIMLDAAGDPGARLGERAAVVTEPAPLPISIATARSSAG
jgi:DNA-binding CsgD family transcriptional regulator